MYLDEIAREIAAALKPGDLPEDDGVERLLRTYAVLARAKGASVTSEDIHDAWAAWMADRDPDHPSVKPFSELDDETKSEDYPFTEAVRSVGARLSRESFP